MTLRDDQVSLRQMFAHASEAIALVQDKDRASLDTERVLSLALVQLLQIIGEAASRVSQPLRDANPQIPWAQIIALRNRLVHGYDVIDLDIVWSILSADLPPLVAEFGRMRMA